VDSETIELEWARMERENIIDGIVFVRNPPGSVPVYGSDADNALFTGMYLAAAAYRHAILGTDASLWSVWNALGGIARLTWGIDEEQTVLARWRIPLENSWRLHGYDIEKSLVAPGNLWGELIRDGQVYEFPTDPPIAIHTRTTKDMLSGVVWGLTVASHLIPAPLVQASIGGIIGRLVARLEATDWSMVDHEGRTGTNAHKVDAPLRLAALALDHKHNRPASRRPQSRWFKQPWLWFNTFYYRFGFKRTFAYNLDMMNLHSLRLLTLHHRELDGVRWWGRRLRKQLGGIGNPHFDALQGEGLSRMSEASLVLQVIRPWPKFYAWEKPSKEWYTYTSNQIGPGLSLTLPWYMEAYRLG